MTDPVPAITAADATGQLAATFADIRATTRVGVVNLIWRHLATIPGALDWAWGAVRPRYADGTLADAADQLRATLILPTLPQLPPPPADAAAILAAYDRTNARALLALCALRARLHGAPGGHTPTASTRAAEADLPLPKLPTLDSLTPDVAAMVLALNHLGAGRPDPILASMYRHLAYWPDFLAAIAAGLQPLDAAGQLRPAIALALTVADTAGQSFAAQLAPSPFLPPQSVAGTSAALDRFAEDALARMVVICAAIRRASFAQDGR